MSKFKFVGPALMASAALAASPVFGSAAHAASASDAQNFVNQSQRVMQQLEHDPTLDGLLRRAKGVLIMPAYGQGGFVVGGRGGEGLAMAHNANGWSDPAFYHVGGVNIGLQAGGAGGAVVMLMMSEHALNDIKGGNNFSLNANAGLSVVTYSAKTRAGWGRADIILWSDVKGLYGGATVGVSDIATDRAENRDYYGHNVTLAQILGGQARNRGATKLAQLLDKPSPKA